MSEATTLNNQVALSGRIISNFEFSHEAYGEGFYIANLMSKRLSSREDVIPIMVSDRLIDVTMDWTGKFVKISGQFRSYNKHEGENSQLILTVFAREFEEITDTLLMNFKNTIFLDGYVCKKPVYQQTPLGREIADILLAVNRAYGKTDYLPMVCWGRTARFADQFEVGSHIQLWGRIQSREYQKRIADDEIVTKIAYEISVNKLQEVEKEF